MPPLGHKARTEHASNGSANGHAETIPPALKPFRFHGLDVDWSADSDECWCDCCFCGSGKMAINAGTGQWSCKVCGGKGNALTFIRDLHERSREATTPDVLEEIRRHRGLATVEPLQAWGVARSIADGHWLVPAFGPDGKVGQVYSYRRMRDGAWALLATPKVTVDSGEEIRHQVMGAAWDHYASSTRDAGKIVPASAAVVYMAEGPWDGMALWEALAGAKHDADGDRLMPTGNREASLLHKACVCAVPGANVWNAAWTPMFAGKKVALLYDNDHPRQVPGTSIVTAPTGWEGMRHAAEGLSLSDQPASAVAVMMWASDGKAAHEPSLPDGCDLRDILTGKAAFNGMTHVGLPAHAWQVPLAVRLPFLQEILCRIKPMPGDWLAGRTQGGKAGGSTELKPLPCVKWDRLIMSVKRSMKWTEGLDRAFSVMLACVASTPAQGDQLWVKIVGPPSCGKSTLCEMLAANKSFIKALSTMRGFHSGFKGEDNDDDTSLLAAVSGKTLVIKDGDTLLQSPNLGQVLSEGRDIYDRVSRAHYRNKISREYENHSMTWILCGTSSLRSLDSSELGERFLDCVIMEGVDEDLEQEILLRVARKAVKASRTSSIGLDGKPTAGSGQSAEMVEAMRLTAGYIDYLRVEGVKLAEGVDWSDEALSACSRLAVYVSFMRARPSLKQDETAERELGARLLGQLIRLGTYLAVTLNRRTIDHEVLRRVTRTAMDTARGVTMELCARMADMGLTGSDPKALPTQVGVQEEKCRHLLRFLKRIGATELRRTQLAPGLPSGLRWFMSPRMQALHAEVSLMAR